jgi:hypothetical protein
MKLSENKVIKTLNLLATIALVIYVVMLIVQILSSSPKASNGIRDYMMNNVIAYPKHQVDTVDHLKSWFNDSVIVQKTNSALVSLRFKNYDDLFSPSAILFQLSFYLYIIMIGALILFVKLFFNSLSKDKVFTKKNATFIMVASLILMWLPIMKWISQELFINCITNDSNYTFTNGEHLLGSETIIGLVLMALGLAFKVGVDIKQENESFV